MRVNSVVPSAWFSTVPRYRPSVEVQPGEVGLAFIYFGPDSALPPADAEYEFTVNTSASNQDFYNTAPLKGTEAARHVMPSWAQPSTPPGSPSRARSPFQSIASTETLCSASTEHSLSRMVLQHQTHRSRSQFRSMVRVVQFYRWRGGVLRPVTAIESQRRQETAAKMSGPPAGPAPGRPHRIPAALSSYSRTSHSRRVVMFGSPSIRSCRRPGPAGCR